MCKLNSTAAYLAEVVSYGGFPLRRADVFAVVMADTADRFAADLFAFSDNRRLMDCEPLTIAEYRAAIGEYEDGAETALAV